MQICISHAESWPSSIIAFGNVEEVNGVLLTGKNAYSGLEAGLSLYTHLNPFQANITFHIETSYLIYSANQMNDYYMKFELKWIKLHINASAE